MIFTSSFWDVAMIRKLKLERFTFTQFASQLDKQTADHELGILFIIIDLPNNVQELESKGQNSEGEVLQLQEACDH